MERLVGNLVYVHLLYRLIQKTEVRLTRNGAFILMSLTPLLFAYLLVALALNGYRSSSIGREYSQAHVEEIVQVIKESTDLSCDWDENDN